ncbi:S9 family peptidase [Prauserella alba]|uniref:S9 family peptidase n=1 Tax=Prauserella alba TaxID=176898 RepID=UPI0020A2DCC1|nr:S9 family peptidase [Prauserella alba]MCP2182716.1 Dipeptidyl aminopeptidase/acylaminoacyl peptidase [Prauserella alba]
MRPTDIELQQVPGRPALSGELLLVSVTRPDVAANAYVGGLHRVGRDGVTAWTRAAHPSGAPRAGDAGPDRRQDSAPAISPDGHWVAFLRSDDGDPAQLHVMPVDGGESRVLTALPLGAGAPVWAPDSCRIAFTARVPEPGRYGTADGEVTPGPAEEAPRRITRYDYRIDNVGFLRDRPQRLFVIDALAEEPDPEPEPLTDDAASVADPVWSPDGETVLVAAPRDWDRVETMHADLYAVPAGGGMPRLVVRTDGRAENPAVTADGTVLFYAAAFDGFARAATNTGLWAAPLDGSRPPRRLTDAESVDCVAAAGPPAPYGDDVLVVVANRGAAELRRVPRAGSEAALAELPVLTGERAAVRSFSVADGRIAVVQAGPSDAGEVLLGDGDGDFSALTSFSEPLRGSGIRPAEEITATSADGHPVHGWVVTPEGDGPHPVLLVVHGGPFAAYEWSLFDEAQVYAAAGYTVVLGNPRGSAGYGESHGRAVLHALGTVDADDLLALLDAVLERPDTDADRVGVMGGSYGGFMTGWLAAHHGERFRAAWSERAVNAWDSFAGSSDIGWTFTGVYVGEDPDEQRKRSPLTYASDIDVPFAVVHSEQDWRCPLEQAQRLFVALKEAGADTEFLLFPGEGHELTRSGKPRHRVQRFEAVLDWWARHLPVH